MAKIVLDDVLGVPSRSQASSHLPSGSPFKSASALYCRMCKQGRHLLSNLRIPESSASLESDIDNSHRHDDCNHTDTAHRNCMRQGLFV